MGGRGAVGAGLFLTLTITILLKTGAMASRGIMVSKGATTTCGNGRICLVGRGVCSSAAVIISKGFAFRAGTSGRVMYQLDVTSSGRVITSMLVAPGRAAIDVSFATAPVEMASSNNFGSE